MFFSLWHTEPRDYHGGRGHGHYWFAWGLHSSVDPLFTNLAISRMYSSKVLKSCNIIILL